MPPVKLSSERSAQPLGGAAARSRLQSRCGGALRSAARDERSLAIGVQLAVCQPDGMLPYLCTRGLVVEEALALVVNELLPVGGGCVPAELRDPPD